jgi:hypothetical protein
MADKLQTPLNPNPCTIGDLLLDLLLQEEEEMANKVTQYPVENGSPAADHVITEPTVLTITGFVTNAPIRAHVGTIDGQARVTRTKEDQLRGSDINFTDLALAYLRKIRLSRTPVTVITKRGTWENMLVERVSRQKSKDTGDALVFTIRLVEFRQVKLVYVSAPRKRTTSARAQPRKEKGKGSATKPKEAPGTILYEFVDGVTKTFFSKVPK